MFLSSVGGLKASNPGRRAKAHGVTENLGDNEGRTAEDIVADNDAGRELVGNSSLASEGTAVQPEIEPVDVVEYLRIGSSTRLRGLPLELNSPKGDVQVDLLGDASLDDRIAAFHRTLLLDNDKSAALSPTLQPFAAVLRTSVIRAKESGSPWTRKDLALATQSGLASMGSWESQQFSSEQVVLPTTRGDLSDDVVELATEHCNILSQVVATTLDATQLAQCLLLDGAGNDEGRTFGTSRLYRFLDGETWHRTMLGNIHSRSLQEEAASCMSAVAEGIETSIIGWNNDCVEAMRSRPKSSVQVGRDAQDYAKKHLQRNRGPRYNSRFDVLQQS